MRRRTHSHDNLHRIYQAARRPKSFVIRKQSDRMVRADCRRCRPKPRVGRMGQARKPTN